MDMLVKAGLVLPNLHQVLTVAVELSQLAGVDLEHDNYIVIGA